MYISGLLKLSDSPIQAAHKQCFSPSLRLVFTETQLHVLRRGGGGRGADKGGGSLWGSPLGMGRQGCHAYLCAHLHQGRVLGVGDGGNLLTSPEALETVSWVSSVLGSGFTSCLKQPGQVEVVDGAKVCSGFPGTYTIIFWGVDFKSVRNTRNAFS